MEDKNITTIQVGTAQFQLDHSYQYVADLLPLELQQIAAVLDDLFDEGNKKDEIIKIVDKVMATGCNTVAMTFFCSMVLQNFGENEKAEALIIPMYENNSADLLAKCAYANMCLFRGKPEEMVAVFGGTLDLEKICHEQTIPLVTFMHFMDLSSAYYGFIGDAERFVRSAQYMFEADPEHPKAQDILKNIIEMAANFASEDGGEQLQGARKTTKRKKKSETLVGAL